MKRKIISVLLAAASLSCAVFASSCSSGSGETYEIGICEFADHPSLKEATESFKATLTEKLGNKVRFTVKNADGKDETAEAICAEFAETNVDLILANATGALQAASTTTAEIPIIGTSVTDYAYALNISNWNGTTGKNITGTSDMTPVADQASMVAELFPSADYNSLGILYCSAETNSRYQSQSLTPMFTALGYTVTEYTFTSSDEISSVTKTACENSNVIFIPTDNTAANYTDSINSIAMSLKTPIITGDENTCISCGVAALSIDYTEIGRKAGLQAYAVLAEDADISKIEIEYADTAVKKYNPEIAAALGIIVPEGYVAIDTAE